MQPRAEVGKNYIQRSAKLFKSAAEKDFCADGTSSKLNYERTDWICQICLITILSTRILATARAKLKFSVFSISLKTNSFRHHKNQWQAQKGREKNHLHS